MLTTCCTARLLCSFRFPLHRGPVPTSLTRGRRVRHPVGGSRSLFKSRSAALPIKTTEQQRRQQRWWHASYRTTSSHAARTTAADSSSISPYSYPDGTARKTRVCRRFGPSRLTLGRSQPCVACMVYRTSVCARPGHTPDSILVCMSSKQWWGVDQTDTERVLTFYMNLKPPPPSDSPLD